jgi:DNA ligase (NAD+)
LIRAGLVQDVADVFSLKSRRSELLELERMGEKSVDKLLDSIDRTRQQPLSRLLFALGIQHVGNEIAELLAGRFGSMATLRNATLEAIDEIEGIGPEIARSVRRWLDTAGNQKVLDKLAAAGVDPHQDVAAQSGPKSLQGKRFVVTGSLERYTRAEAQSLIKSLGGQITGSVSKKTDYVVVGAEPGSKLDDARRLGVTTIDEDAFVRLVNEAPG